MKISADQFKWLQRVAIMIGTITLIHLTVGGGAIFAQSATITTDSGVEESLPPVCRLGANVNSTYGEPPINGFDTAPLRLGWYIDYSARAYPSRPQGMNYTPVIRLKQTGSDSYYSIPEGQMLEDSVLAHKGEDVAWFIGNEPDRKYYQDDIEPQVYATAYHELREQIRAIDPTAEVIAGSIVQASDVRIKYLDLILESHQTQYGEPMAVDGWATHGFILNEVSCTNNPLGIPCWGADIPPGVGDSYGLIIDVQDSDDFDIFKANIVRMRQWMADNGYRNTPLFLSEYGVLMPSGRFTPDFTPERVSEFMTKSFNYALYEGVDGQIGYPQDGNRLIQYLSWYSTSDNTDFNGYLYDLSNGGQLSLMGENYAIEAATINDDHDFTPLSISVGPQILILEQGGDRKASVSVGVNIANAGNNLYPQAVPVRLFDAFPPAGGQSMGNGVANVAGCGEEAMTYISILLPWDGESLDDLPQSLVVFAQVNPDNTVPEVGAGENNNLISTVLPLANLPRVHISLDAVSFLPLIQR